jgi:hypothetical protein
MPLHAKDVRLLGQTGSDRQRVNPTRLTQSGPEALRGGLVRLTELPPRQGGNVVVFNPTSWSLEGHMRRREFIELMGGLAASTALKPAFAERSLKLIVWINAFPFAPERPFPTRFLKGMQELGYVKGRDFAYAERGGNGIADAARVAEETIQLKPDIIIASSTLEAVAAKNATSTIPIICPALADAVHLGLIASEARPGGNVTGIEPYVGGLPAKQIELAREIVPGATKIGLLTNNLDPKGVPQVAELKAAGQALDLQIISTNADRPEEIEAALHALEGKSRCSHRASDQLVPRQPSTDSKVGAAETAPNGFRVSRACLGWRADQLRR